MNDTIRTSILFKSLGLFAACALFLTGCTANQQERMAELWAPFDKAHNIRIIQDSLDRPSNTFSLHIVAAGENKEGYILKANRLQSGERFLLGAIDGITGVIRLLCEFESLPDGSLEIYSVQGKYSAESLPLARHDQILVSKPTDYVLVRKKDCTSSLATFLPYPIGAKGEEGERISLFVAHPMLTRFQLQGLGFFPKESLRLVHQSDGRVETLEIDADESGAFEAPLNPVIIGKLGGSARLAVIYRGKTLNLDYPWGTHLENLTFKEHRAFPILFVANKLPHEQGQDPLQNSFFCIN